MDIRPILSTLLRHKTAAALIVLEIALSCAIVCNALFLIQSRIERMDKPSGLAEDTLVTVRVRGMAKDEQSAAVTRADLAALRAIPGVTAAASVNQIPFGNSSWNSSVNLVQDQEQPNLGAATYLGSEQTLEAFGLTLVAGRGFQPDEFVEWDALNTPGDQRGIPAVILTRTVAEKLFPGESAVGKSIYSWGDPPHRVVGVVERLTRPNEIGGEAESDYSLLFPVRMPYDSGGFVLRVDDPSRRQEVLRAALQTLESSGPTRIISEDDARTFEQVRADYYRQDRSMAWLLVAVIVALLVVTALGIVGLASFWVQQRTKQIGVRRALGATRGQILRYFQTENFLLATVGIVLGMVLAYAINQLLMGRYELPRLPLAYLPIGALVLWLLGQAAVFWPARRAAAVPPAVATRSV
ncbi:ABC transporter permease [Luteimonas vadosa]|uniref:ABC transporter permease n=1 Tax=Luteimonas vadosa TaxID=1165507 RepID=A0ABP9DWI3_9GAMM